MNSKSARCADASRPRIGLVPAIDQIPDVRREPCFERRCETADTSGGRGYAADEREPERSRQVSDEGGASRHVIIAPRVASFAHASFTLRDSRASSFGAQALSSQSRAAAPRNRRERRASARARASQRGERQAVLVAPARQFAERARPRIGLAASPVPARVAAFASAGRPARSAVPPASSQSSRLRGNCCCSCADHAQRVVVSLLAVVDDDERRSARWSGCRSERGGVLDQPDAPLAAAAETREVREHALDQSGRSTRRSGTARR